MITKLVRQENFGRNLSNNVLGEAKFQYYKTFNDNVIHRKDNILHKGYAYQGNTLFKTLSRILFNEKKRESILMSIELIITHLIDSVKDIKKSYNWVLSKNYIDFN